MTVLKPGQDAIADGPRIPKEIFEYFQLFPSGLGIELAVLLVLKKFRQCLSEPIQQMQLTTCFREGFVRQHLA
ncbi:hypothetical protein D3C86_1983730 [compost metagenome]